MWQKITIDFKEKLEKYTEKKIEMCDYSFTNLYMWSFGDNISYREEKGILYIKGSYLSDEDYFMPLSQSGKLEEIKEGVDRLLSEKKQIKYVSQEFIDQFGKEYLFEEMADSFDYVYQVEDLAFLKGRKYSKKKNKLNQFKKTYSYTYERLSDGNLSKVIEFQKSWCIKKNCEESENLKSEGEGLEHIFRNYSKLNLVGGVILVDGSVIAYTIGEKLTEDMVVIHIEKADELYNGSYQAINSFYLQNEWQGVEFVNREDDAGIEGIRKAKQSYFPTKFVKKYSIFGKKDDR